MEEDEKIRKTLICHFNYWKDSYNESWHGIKIEDILDWLKRYKPKE